MSHIFISYSRQDIDFARYTRALLENHGFAVWMDEKRLSAGMDWWGEIESSIDSCGAFLVVMSPDARESVFVQNEILRAIDQKKALYPVLYRGQHFGMLAHVQYEDMRGGLNAPFSEDFLNRLRDTVGLATKRTIRFDVLHQAIQSVEADVILHKLAPGSTGVDKFLIKQLKQGGIEVDLNLLSNVGDYSVVDTHQALKAGKVALIKTEWVGSFGYRQVRQFAERGLSILSHEAPTAKHILMTIHGANTRLRLDEGESVLAQLAGLVDVLQSWGAPPALDRISIVEFDADRVQRIKRALQDYFDEVHYAQPTSDADWGYDLTFEREGHVESPTAGDEHIKPYAIALFPEDPELEDVFYYGIERTTHAMGLLCERLNPDVQDTDFETVQVILERIKHASAVICDMSTPNPLLYLQCGYAWGADIPTVLISREDTQYPELGALIYYDKIWQLEERLSNWLKQL